MKKLTSILIGCFLLTSCHKNNEVSYQYLCDNVGIEIGASYKYSYDTLVFNGNSTISYKTIGNKSGVLRIAMSYAFQNCNNISLTYKEPPSNSFSYFGFLFYHPEPCQLMKSADKSLILIQGGVSKKLVKL